MKISGFILVLVILACGRGFSQFKERPRSVSANLGYLQNAENSDSRKSVVLGVVLSLVLPGAGEWYAGNLSTGRYFMGADGVLWLSYAGVSLRGDWIRDDARLFASEHAGASMNGKEQQFEVDLGNYISTDEYNQAKLRSREYDLLYVRPEYVWNWDTEQSRLHYRGLRVRSDEYARNAKFFVGALVVNRIISAFSAWRSVNRHNKALEAGGGWDLKAEIQGGLPANTGLALKLSKSF